MFGSWRAFEMRSTRSSGRSRNASFMTLLRGRPAEESQCSGAEGARIVPPRGRTRARCAGSLFAAVTVIRGACGDERALVPQPRRVMQIARSARDCEDFAHRDVALGIRRADRDRVLSCCQIEDIEMEFLLR